MSKGNGNIFRVNKENDYTVMANHHLRNKELSLRSKGLLSHILSLPDDWDYTINGLVAINKDGRQSIETGLKELEEHGYLIREQDRTGGKFGRMIYTVYEVPPSTGKPFTVKPCTEKPFTGNHQQISTKETSTNKTNTKETEPYSPLKDFDTFWEKYPRKVGKGKARQSFKKQVTSKEIYEQIMEDLDNRKYDEQWTKDNGKFIPHPSTYLNQERWLDEYEKKGKTDERAANFGHVF